jgi:hypothetical protein
MKHFLLTLLLATLCATGYGQTIKSLGYNTTNGEVVYTGTNVLTFTNNISLSGDSFFASSQYGAGTNSVFIDAGGISFGNPTIAAITRTNLGLGATWLTNTNVTNFRTAVGLGATNDVTFQSIDAAELRFETQLIFELDGATFHTPLAFDNTTNAAITRTNLGLGGGIATNISVLVSGGDTNTLQFSNGILTNVTSP